MAEHRVFLDNIPEPGHIARVEGPEAHHALRSKRLSENDHLVLINGQGTIANARIQTITRSKGHSAMDCIVQAVQNITPLLPSLHIHAAPPKGSRLESMIDALSQIGAHSYHPLRTKRTVVVPRDGKLHRLEHVAFESAKQCARAWQLQIQPSCNLTESLDHKCVVVADAEGEPYQATVADEIHLVIGPEGGLTPSEIDHARQAGAMVCSFGQHVMRIETAAAVAAAIVLERELANTKGQAGSQL